MNILNQRKGVGLCYAKMYFLIFQLEGMLKLSINFRRISAYKSYAYNKKRM